MKTAHIDTSADDCYTDDRIKVKDSLFFKDKRYWTCSVADGKYAVETGRGAGLGDRGSVA